MIVNSKHSLTQVLSIFSAAIILLIVWSAASHAHSFPGEEKIFHETLVDQVSEGGSEDLIIIFDEAPAVRTAASLRTQSGTGHDTDEIVRAKVSMYRSMKAGILSGLYLQEVETLKDYSHLPAMYVNVKSLEGLQKLAAQAGVKGIYKNRMLKHFLSQSLPLIEQPAAQAAGFTGAGTAVAVLDSGVNYTHSAFGSCTGSSTPGDCLSLPLATAGCRVACVHDFAPDDGRIDDFRAYPYPQGHGTNVSAVVAGVAPGTKIIGLDIFDGDSAYDADILAAMDWVIENRNVYNITAINMSLGVYDYGVAIPCSFDLFAVPVAEARAAGILSAIASGNDGYTNAISSPACVPAAVSVGAVYDSAFGSVAWCNSPDITAADKVACFSNNADFLTLLAPGARIDAGGWIMSGTSQATPHVAGAIAVLRGANAFPGESVDSTVNRLVSTGVPVTDTRDPYAPVTRPRIDLAAALDVPVLGRITGHVYATADGSPLSGVTVALTGDASRSVISGSDGSFVFDDLLDGTYTVTPTRSGYNFAPAARDLIVSGADQNNVTFVRAFSISGYVKAKKGSMVFPDVTITLSGASSAETVTDSTGYFQFEGLMAGSYTVTPDKLNFVFTPAVKGISLNKKNVALVFKVRTYAISGIVKTAAGARLSGVSLTVTGCGIEASGVTNSKGKFKIANLPNCNYTVSAADSSGHIFSPGSIIAAVNSSNVPGITFSSL